MGVNRTRFKLLAFAVGAGFAGMTGTFYVAKLQTATPEMFGFPVSAMILVMVVFGGMGSVWGVVVGAVVYLLMLTNVFSFILQALAYQGIFVVAWVGIALCHILRNETDPAEIEDAPALRREGLSAWFVSAAVGIALLKSGGIAAGLSAPATALLSFLLYALLQRRSAASLALQKSR
jgi:hypothetical protein